MLLITCPVCGATGDETDFHYGGEAHVARPASHDPATVSTQVQRDYLYIRRNAKGIHFERWRCDRGCAKWFQAVRDTLTMRFLATYGAGEQPPADVIALIPKTSPWYGVFTPPPAPDIAPPTASGNEGDRP